MKIAIHNRPGSFSDYWIEHCKTLKIPYVFVNCFDTNIIQNISGCNGLMWHWAQWDSRAIIFARQLTYALEHKGIKVFPNSKTCWHFDDKVGQKYLLESMDAPLVPSYVFYDKKEASDWAENTEFPKVFKLRGGAGSVNVKLIRDKKQALSFIRRAFGKGFRATDRLNHLQDRFLRYNREKDLAALVYVLKGFVRLVLPRYDDAMRVRDKGYFYFQDYIPNNKYDIRVIVIGEKAFAIKRMIRKNDFRASGSGNIHYEKKEIPLECVGLSFEVTKKLSAQCLAFDYIFDRGAPMIVEISYGFAHDAYLNCPGYWDEQLKWHDAAIIPAYLILEEFINEFEKLEKPN